MDFALVDEDEGHALKLSGGADRLNGGLIRGAVGGSFPTGTDDDFLIPNSAARTDDLRRRVGKAGDLVDRFV